MANLKNNLTSTNLKQALWETLLGVRSKKISPEIANSTAHQSREIMRVVKTEIQVLTLAGIKPGQKMLEFTKQ